jgi:UDPglucose 6-dehydrogenase
MNLAIIGSGYVGLVAGACFADTGHDVYCVDVDQKKIDKLKRGEIPIYEPGLSDIIKRSYKEGRLKFTTSLSEAVSNSQVVFIAVGTPQDEDGAADLTHVLAVAREIGRTIAKYPSKTPRVIVTKSTVPVGTGKKVKEAIASETTSQFDVVSNPEFLKEGAAIDDFMKPDRIVIGVENSHSAEVMREIYAPFVRNNNPILIMDLHSAEMTKYAANAMLAARISFMNELALLCEATSADIEKVRIGIGTDSRIGMSFLFPGIGYGGSCFPKDVQALIKTAKDHKVELKVSRAVEEVNYRQKRHLVDKIKNHFASQLNGRNFAVWGLAFKPKTDDTREAPALVIVDQLQKMGAKLNLYDPEAASSFRHRIGEKEGIIYRESAYQALEGADALIICTEWGEFRRPNFERIKSLLKTHVIFDGRNLYDPVVMRDLGFNYYSVGRA